MGQLGNLRFDEPFEPGYLRLRHELLFRAEPAARCVPRISPLRVSLPVRSRPMSSAAGVEVEGWAARLELEVIRDGEKSRLARRSHFGPLRVQRPFYPEGGGVVHVYLLHPPGGMVGGDQLETRVDVRTQASLLITTPAAQKLYRSLGQTSLQTQLLRVESQGVLEWLPSETIVFDGARASVSTRVELAPDATFLGWDLGCFGRPASRAAFSRGELRQHFEIYRAGLPLLVDRSHVVGGSETLTAPWGYGAEPVYGSLYCAAGQPVDLDALAREVRGVLEERTVRVAVTVLDGLLVVRALSAEVERARAALVAAWRVARPWLSGRAAAPPRIWAT